MGVYFVTFFFEHTVILPMLICWNYYYFSFIGLRLAFEYQSVMCYATSMNIGGVVLSQYHTAVKVRVLTLVLYT